MSDFLRFLVLGLGPGALYALLAVGVVMIYRGSGVVNFGFGGFALVGAAVYMELLSTSVGKAGAAVIAVLASACLGVLVQILVLHPIRRASPLARIVATLGVAAALDFGGRQAFGVATRFVPGFLPSRAVNIGGVVVGEDRFWILGITVVLTGGLWAVYRFSQFGIATTAIAENPRASAALGWSPMLLAILNWAFGGAVAGFAGVLLVPLTGFSPDGFSLLVVPALAAAVLAMFRSLGLALICGLVIGILESESVLLHLKHPQTVFGVVPTVGLDSVVPFLVVLIVLLVRGRPLPLRGELTDRLPALGNPVPRWPVIIVVFFLVALSVFSAPAAWAGAVTLSAVVAVLALSVVVITGYAGQLSLAQFGLAGIGALVSSRLADVGGLDFVPAAVVGVAAAVVVGLLVAIPATRVRGVNLAVITLSLGVVITDAVLANTDWNGGAITGTVVPTPTIAGFKVGSVNNPDRWAMLCLVVLVLCCLVVSNLRRGRSGRRLIAVRDNERAAASLGVNVVNAKLYAFGVGSGLAGLAGVLLAFQYPNVDFSQYTPLQSIQIVLLSVIGGLGFIAGSFVAGIGITGGVAQNLLNHLAETSGWFGFILAVLFLVAVVVHPDGLAERLSVLFRQAWLTVIAPLGSWAARTRGWAGRAVSGSGGPKTSLMVGGPAVEARAPLAPGLSVKLRPMTLEVRDLTVRFGGVVALENVSFSVAAGTTLGLIGPNGAGKTTLVDAVCGFLPRYDGHVLLDGKRIDQLRAYGRVHLGLTRSFQSLELFEDLTIADNLRIAADRGRRREFFYDLFAPRRQPLPPVAMAACESFGLLGLLGKRPGELAYAERRAAAIARAVAAEPSVLLLDEPAAGLDPEARRRLEELIRRLAGDFGMAVVLIEHDVGMIMRTCDEVIALNFGRPFSRGTPEQVRRDPQLVHAYLGSGAADDPSRRPAYEREQPMNGTSGQQPRPGPVQPVLEAVGLSVGYGANPVVRDVNLRVNAGEVVALLGANGGGKTTTLLGLAGELRPLEGAVRMYGSTVTSRLHRRARAGLAYISEEKSVISELSVTDNLRLGRGNLDLAFQTFPELDRLRRRRAGTLSGGEQQILTYARALSRSPRILIADELSLGLAPVIVQRLIEAIRTAARNGLAVLIVEQQVHTALAACDRAYLLRQGQIILEGPAQSLADRINEIEVGYLSE